MKNFQNLPPKFCGAKIDIFEYFNKNKEKSISEIIKRFYSNKNLIKAVQSQNEIMIKCNFYYAINATEEINLKMLFNK